MHGPARTLSGLRRGASLDGVADEANLVELGIIDSLSVVQIVMHLETNYQKSVAGVDMTTLVSVQGILDVIHS